ncbi:MAG: DNA primase [Patescibacteria group bacterium]|nr:DNA primase [Patescibacteria group bacterium]MDE2116550.1 DNA primase [Patescibacteria group bacterium]
MSTHVQEIKDKLDIVQVVGSYIKLDKTGANYKARCPFHNEKTPSFFVSPDRGTFYCFGCQAKGDIFTFVEKFEGLDFMGALKVLADRAGVKLDRTADRHDNRKELLYEILEKATAYFEEQLAAEPHAKTYILGRGLAEKTLDTFRVGYAPNDWRRLRTYLKDKGYHDEDVAAVGLIKKTDKPSGDPYYDVFRGRIMFPIADSSGRVVAFSGRIVEDDGTSPKYLNSPETALYVKSKILYGLDKAKSDIRKRGYSILVEGQMDLVMSHQAGFSNTVAASGTAFTEDDGADSAFGLLTRLSDNIVLAFDSDSAGQKAIKRIGPALALGMNVKVVDIKGGKDPADIIKADPKEWAKALETKKDFIDYLVDAIVDSKAPPAVIAKEVKQNLFPYVAAIPEDTPRFQAIKKIAERLSISEDALWKDLQTFVKANPSRSAAASAAADAADKPARLDRLESIERKILGLLRSKRYFGDDEAKEKELVAIIGADRSKAFEALPPDDVAALTLEAEITYGDMPPPAANKEWRILLLNLEEEYAKRRLSAMMVDLHKAEKANADTAHLIQDIHVLTKRIQEVKDLAEKA